LADFDPVNIGVLDYLLFLSYVCIFFSEVGKHKEEKRNEIVTNQDENVRRIVEEELQKTEERLKVYVEKQMSSLEEKLNEKLDKILICISKMDNTHPP